MDLAWLSPPEPGHLRPAGFASRRVFNILLYGFSRAQELSHETNSRVVAPLPLSRWEAITVGSCDDTFADFCSGGTVQPSWAKVERANTQEGDCCRSVQSHPDSPQSRERVASEREPSIYGI